MKGAVSGSLPGGELSFPACRVLTVAAGWIKQEDECFSFTFRLLWYEILSTELTGRRGSCTCAAALNTRELCSEAELHCDWQQQDGNTFPSKVWGPDYCTFYCFIGQRAC